MDGISPQAVDLVRAAVAGTSDQQLWGTVGASSRDASELILLAEIVIVLNRIEAVLRGVAASERDGRPAQ